MMADKLAFRLDDLFFSRANILGIGPQKVKVSCQPLEIHNRFARSQLSIFTNSYFAILYNHIQSATKV